MASKLGWLLTILDLSVCLVIERPACSRELLNKQEQGRQRSNDRFAVLREQCESIFMGLCARIDD